MAARFVYWMNVSLDLRIEARPGESGGGDWLRIGESLHREFNRRAGSLAAMVQGRKVYETMEGFWPAARFDETLPDYLREYGHIWSDAPKVLVSRTRTEAGHHTRVIGGEGALAQLATLREESEGDIGVGGATLASHLMRAGLLDELLLFVHPTILGRGRPLFDGEERVACDLLELAEHAGGVTMQRYAIRQPRLRRPPSGGGGEAAAVRIGEGLKRHPIGRPEASHHPVHHAAVQLAHDLGMVPGGVEEGAGAQDDAVPPGVRGDGRRVEAEGVEQLDELGGCRRPGCALSRRE